MFIQAVKIALALVLVSSPLNIALIPSNDITIPADEVQQAQIQKFQQFQIPEILSRIAWCESGNRQFDRQGRLIRGKINPADLGRFQINETLHYQTALTLGYDIYTEVGNQGYALWLYKTQGTTPWKWSQHCWSK